MSSQPAADSGFTLIEILVAMTILFSVVTTGFVAYQTALAAGERANQTRIMLTALPFIKQQIRNELLNQPTQTQGEGSLLSVTYRFENQPGPLTGAPDVVDEQITNADEGKARFRLHRIQLELYYLQQTRTFAYQELTWID